MQTALRNVIHLGQISAYNTICPKQLFIRKIPCPLGQKKILLIPDKQSTSMY